MNVLSLFAGIGGLDLGLERVGMRVVGQVEINPWCRTVLSRHWPEVPKHDDVRTAIDWWRSKRRPTVHVIAGGYPCQPESTAGLRRGTDDERWLWPEFARLIHEIEPYYVIGENVAGHRTKGLRFVLRDLERLGYTARAGLVSACAVGAPHMRKRMFVLAHAVGKRRPAWRTQPGSAPTPSGQHQDGAVPAGNDWWAIEPGVGRVAYGLPDRVDRVRGLGNAVVPQVAEHMGRLLLSGEWLA